MLRSALIATFLLSAANAHAEEYQLDIAQKMVNVTGSPVEKITVNGTIPGPTLHFQEGEDVTIRVTNHLDESSSIHWHGLLVPGIMDGVPGTNGFHGIAPGETYVYHFPTRQSGTYWYHAHSIDQEQDGLYGSIIISPKGSEAVKADRDYVVLFSDFKNESAAEIIANVKMDSDYYSYNKRTVGDFFHDVKTKGLDKAWKYATDWGSMRMSPTDLSDVSGYTFLTNGMNAQQNWTGQFKAGERVRLRFINAAAMSIYDVRIPGLKMTVVAADGQPVEPVTVDEFRFGVAETYDVIVQPNDDKAYTIAAESIDRTGFAIGTLAPQEGMRGDAPIPRPRTMLTMADMNMEMMMQADPDMVMADRDMETGWDKAGTPPGHKALSYADLRAKGVQSDTRKPTKEIALRLGGNMERFIWTINGKKFVDAKPIPVNYGERVRLNFINETMMAHPMHLHGIFVQLENGQPMSKMPNKHTIIIPPGQTVSVLLTANEVGEWAFHCHLLYHMLGGMMTTLQVYPQGEQAPPSETVTQSGEGRMPGMEGGMEMDGMKMKGMEDMHHGH